MLNSLIGLDVQISTFLRTLVVAGSPLVPVVRVFSDLEVFMVVVLLLIWWLRGVQKKSRDMRVQALDLFYAIGLAFGMYWILNLGLPMRPRPEMISSLPPLLNHLPDNSFPSGHAIFAGASVFAIARYMSGRMAALFAFVGLFMLLSRVIAGVHYFGDIFVGTILGVAFAWLYDSIRTKLSDNSPLHTIPLKIASFIKL